MNAPLLKTWGFAAALGVAGFLAAYQFVEPAPPDELTLATGGPEGAYHAFGLALASELATAGVTLNLRNSAGARDNLNLLASGLVDVALVQGGMDPPQEGGASIRSLASLYYEPLWVFHRMTPAPVTLTELAQGRVNRGRPGSGTRALTDELLEMNGMQAADWPELADPLAAQALQSGELDAAFMVAGENAPYIRQLLTTPGITLMNLQRAPAYHLHRRYLSAVSLPAGGVDLARNIPANDTGMIAVAAMLVATEDLHPALVDLILQKAANVAGEGGLFSERGEFPSASYVSIPLDSEAERFHRRGPSLLQRFLPFWAATLVDRMIVLLLPLVALVLPLLRVFPPLYRWRVRSRIYRWYDDLRSIERRHDAGEPAPELLAAVQKLVDEVKLVAAPLSYTDELYHLRQHIELVRTRIKRLASDTTSRDVA